MGYGKAREGSEEGFGAAGRDNGGNRRRKRGFNGGCHERAADRTERDLY